MEMVNDSEVLPSWTFCNAAVPVLASTSSKAAKPFLFSHSLDLLDKEGKIKKSLKFKSNQHILKFCLFSLFQNPKMYLHRLVLKSEDPSKFRKLATHSWSLGTKVSKDRFGRWENLKIAIPGFRWNPKYRR